MKSTAAHDSKFVGLTSEQAAKQLARFGPNIVTETRAIGWLRDALHFASDPMGVMLLTIGFIDWFTGAKTDAIILFIAYIPVTAVDVLLEIRSNRALQLLKEHLSPTVKVYRDGTIRDLAIKDLVPEDVIVFEEGQTLPADGEIFEAVNLTLNESALTGESIPVEKAPGDEFYGGTAVMAGRGLGRVQKTGRHSRFGNIAKALSEIDTVQSPLQKKTHRIVTVIFAVAIALAVSLFVHEWLTTKALLPSLIVSLTLAMAAIPEEFPMVLTLYLSLGAWRLSKKGLLVKSLPSVETLGGVDVICTDKTGTLTEGLFQLETLEPASTLWSENDLVKFAIMACEPAPVDALELAIFARLKNESLIRDWRLIYDYPFEIRGKHMSHVWQNLKTGETVIAMKGAVEGVLEHCLADTRKDKIITTAERHAADAKRVLGLAVGVHSCNGDRDHDERQMTFAGYFIFSDPVRSTVKESIEKCQSAGIEVKMLTGDHLLTAHAIADQIGLHHAHDKLWTGDLLSRLSADERRQAYLSGAIFARVLPTQKLELVQTLRESGRVVAMTGDGINDALALKSADIGISMGQNATDVARSTAKMVLLQNNFSNLVDAVFEGRRIYGNLRRSFSYLISFHVPIVLLALAPPFLNWPPLLLPIHIVILELIVHPVSAFTFESERPVQLHKNSPGNFLSQRQFISAGLSGLFVSIAALILFRSNILTGHQLAFARAVAFAAVLFGNIGFVAAESKPYFDTRFFVTTGILLAFTAVAAFVSPLNQFLHFSIVEPREWAIAILAAAASVGFRFWPSRLTPADSQARVNPGP